MAISRVVYSLDIGGAECHNPPGADGAFSNWFGGITPEEWEGAVVATRASLGEFFAEEEQFEKDKKSAMKWAETQGFVVASVYAALVASSVPVDLSEHITLNFADKYFGKLMANAPTPEDHLG
jgi:hypothetical protein